MTLVAMFRKDGANLGFKELNLVLAELRRCQRRPRLQKTTCNQEYPIAVLLWKEILHHCDPINSVEDLDMVIVLIASYILEPVTLGMSADCFFAATSLYYHL